MTTMTLQQTAHPTKQVMYEVHGGYSRDEYRDEYLDEFSTRVEAEQYVTDFEKVYGRYAYVVET